MKYMNYNYRKHLKDSLTSRLGADNAGELLIAFSIIENQYGADKALDITLEAAQKLLHQSHASTGLPLNWKAQQIEDELSRVNRNHGKNFDKKFLLANEVERFNKLIGKVEFRIVHNGKVFGLSEADEAEMRVEIPRSLRAKEKLKETYAASDVKSRIKGLSITVKL
jgi:hypothetical protein